LGERKEGGEKIEDLGGNDDKTSALIFVSSKILTVNLCIMYSMVLQ
jgi:hypothetical protein